MSSSQDSGTRKLAAIMFTDIKAFSWKMASNEIAAMQILKTHDSMMTESIVKFGGRVIKSIGDSFMVDFPSAVNAVSCALELQERFWEHNTGKSEFEKIEVRMGLHLGDVIDVGNDMYGDGVNIASRVEAITEPNRICITQDIYSQVKKKMNLNVFTIGPMKFKNIDEPVEVYEILMDTVGELSVPSQTAKQAPSRKVAEKSAEREAKEAKTVEAKKQKHLGDLQERIKVHYKKAEIFFQKGLLEQAEAELNEIEKLTGDVQQAEKPDKEEDERQKKIQALYRNAEEEFRKGRLDEAEKEIQEIYRLVPIHYGSQMIMAQIEEERFRLAEERRRKIESDRRALQQKTEQIDSLKRQIQAHVQREEYPLGLQVVQEMFALDPENDDAKALQERLQQLQREKEEREQAAAEEAERILQATMEKRAEQARAAEPKVEEAVEVKPAYNKKLILQVVGGVAAIVALFFLFSMLKTALFPNKASLAVIPLRASGTNGALTRAFATILAEDFARQENVSVVSPFSALAASAGGKSKEEIAAELGVQQLVLVKVEQRSDDLSVDAELFEAGSDLHWTGNLTADDILQASTIRRQILSTVLEQLEVSSEIGEFTSPTKNPNAYLLYLIGRSLSNQRNSSLVQQGRDSLTAALQLDDTFAQAYAARAHATVQLFKAGGEANSALLNTALLDLQRATEGTNESALAYQVLGEVSRYRNRFADAREALEKSLSLQPGNAACYRELALIAITEGAYGIASDHSKKALALDPRHPESLVTAGLVAHFKKEYEEALNWYNQGISLGANDSLVTVRYKLNIWANLEMRQEAQDYCKKLQQQFPQDYRTNYWVARALQQQGRWDESKSYLKTARTSAESIREVKADDVSLHGYLTLIMARLAKLDDAQKEIEFSIRLHGTTPEILYRRANVYAIQGQQGIANALNALKVAVQAEFNFVEILNPDLLLLNKEPEFATAIVRTSESQ